MFSLQEYLESPPHYEEPATDADWKQYGRDTRPIPQIGSLPDEQGPRRPISLLASFCAEGSALAAISGHETICAILLLLGLSGIAWIRRTESKTLNVTTRLSKVWAFVVTALVILACATVILLIASRPHYRVFTRMTAPKRGDGAVQKANDDLEDSYVSVILWPKLPKDARIVAPPPPARVTSVAHLSKPLVIPFEGVYWYLQSPAKTPGRNAHVTQGNPAKINIHSTDWHPLIMEAHQRLSSSIDSGCCRELDLSIVNADNRPGEIRIAVELIDSSAHHAQSEDLGVRPVLSSMPPEFSLSRPPTSEVLKYPMPTNPAIHQFNEIEVVFLPSRERSLGGAQIAIRSFRLIPSW